jgi:hypothetical protein
MTTISVAIIYLLAQRNLEKGLLSPGSSIDRYRSGAGPVLSGIERGKAVAQ